MSLYDYIKKIMQMVMPAYRVSLRNEQYIAVLNQKIDNMQQKTDELWNSVEQSVPSTVKKTPWGKYSMTAEYGLMLSCFAQEIYETHKAAFLEFKYCHQGRDIVVVATGPTMRYYNSIPGAVHIGMNAAYKRQDIKLDYLFVTDFANRHDFFSDLKEYDFIKFFGQYSPGIYRETFQVSEQMLRENHARKFFQGAPAEDIPLNIEYYPLMGFYTVAFQAIQFALYTNPRRIFLVGCDCTSAGYYDGTKDNVGEFASWMRGYEKLKVFAARFYPETEIISVNPVGLKGYFRDMYTSNYLFEHSELDRENCEILKV